MTPPTASALFRSSENPTDDFPTIGKPPAVPPHIEHAPLIAQAARRYGTHLSYDAAHNIALEGFLRGWESWKPTGAKQATFAMTCCRYALIKSIRQHQTKKNMFNETMASLDVPLSADPSADTLHAILPAENQHPADRLAAEELRAAVDRLPARQRTIIDLVYYQGLNLSAAGRVLSITCEGVRVHLARALQNLRAHLTNPLTI